MTCWGKLFQIQAAATGKARFPTVDSPVRPTIGDEDEAEQSIDEDMNCFDLLCPIHTADADVTKLSSCVGVGGVNTIRN